MNAQELLESLTLLYENERIEAKRAQDTGYELVGNTPDQFGAFLATEHKRSGAALQGKAKID